MIIWSGWGILTVAIVALVGGPVTALAVAAFNAAGLGRYSGLGLVLGLFVAAAVNWMVGKRLNTRPGRELLDPATGQTVVLRESHRLFFIPMQWWSVALALVAVFGLFVNLLNPGPATPPATAPKTFGAT